MLKEECVVYICNMYNVKKYFKWNRFPIKVVLQKLNKNLTINLKFKPFAEINWQYMHRFLQALSYKNSFVKSTMWDSCSNSHFMTKLFNDLAHNVIENVMTTDSQFYLNNLKWIYWKLICRNTKKYLYRTKL